MLQWIMDIKKPTMDLINMDVDRWLTVNELKITGAKTTWKRNKNCIVRSWFAPIPYESINS